MCEKARLMTFNNVVLAMDLSLTSPGFAVLAITDEGQPLILEKTHVKTKAKETHGQRLSDISGEIDRLLLRYNPEHVVREKGFSRFPAVTQTLFKVVGISDLCVATFGLTPSQVVHEIAPTSVKKLVTGNGRADKQAVQDAVIKRLRIDKPDYFANDDESDAAGVGLAYYIEKGLIDV